ncbi:DUF6397 family protein [Streptomyces sp. CC210A]|uniref:DUF6397 family protein n=1 Tax=Streptomyces sp. CC210A TaxID=2898184 RepID=UPI001F43A6F4|nr:DUF6397 family protein [Streptomyces sp. CC210A]
MTTADTMNTLAPTRAAQELMLRSNEFALAVHLGLVRAPAAAPGERRRIPWEEVQRLRAEPDFPDGLRERVRTFGTAQAADLAGITPDRFVKLARTGHFTPIGHYVNRYRAVVWLYLGDDVRAAAACHRTLLDGRLPRSLLVRLRDGADDRPRTWRSRRLGLLLGESPDPWRRAAVLASFLDPALLAEEVADPSERAFLDRVRPVPLHGRAERPTRQVAERLQYASEPDEIRHYATLLREELRDARALRPAPRPPDDLPRTCPGPTPPVLSAEPRPGLLGRLRASSLLPRRTRARRPVSCTSPT